MRLSPGAQPIRLHISLNIVKAFLDAYRKERKAGVSRFFGQAGSKITQKLTRFLNSGESELIIPLEEIYGDYDLESNTGTAILLRRLQGIINSLLLEKSCQFEAIKNELLKDSIDEVLIINWLITCPDCYALQDSAYKTLLHYIVELDCIPIQLMKHILQNLSLDDISSYDENCLTPLHLACRKDPLNFECIQLLIQYGADPTLLDNENYNVFNWSYHRVNENHQVLGVLYDGLNKQQLRSRILPTMEELRKQYGSDMRATNRWWALNAVSYVNNVNALKAPNDLKGNKHTGGYSREVYTLMHKEFHELYPSMVSAYQRRPYMKFAIRIYLQARLLELYRGGGDCFFQASSAFYYLLQNKVKNVEYFTMEDVGLHHFVLIGRDPNSNPQNPDTWGIDVVICDPWANKCFFASDFCKPREFNEVKAGRPFRVMGESKAIRFFSEIDKLFSNTFPQCQARQMPVGHKELQQELSNRLVSLYK